MRSFSVSFNAVPWPCNAVPWPCNAVPWPFKARIMLLVAVPVLLALASCGGGGSPGSSGPGGSSSVTIAGHITEYQFPGSANVPFTIAAGPDGKLWIEGYSFSSAGSGASIEVATTSGQFTPVTFSTPLTGSLSNLASGPDGNLWFLFSSGQQTSCVVARLTPAGNLTTFPTPKPLSTCNTITAGPNGDLWFTGATTADDASVIGSVTPQGAVTLFPVPIQAQGQSVSGSSISGIIAGPDGNLWFDVNISASSTSVGLIAKMTPQGAVTSYQLPAGQNAGEFFSGHPIAAGPDGNVWFTVTQGSGSNATYLLDRVTPSGAITAVPFPAANEEPLAIVAGPDGNLWATEATINPPATGSTTTSIASTAIARITPSGTVKLFPLPAHGGMNIPLDITVGPDHALWFTEADIGQNATTQYIGVIR